MPLSKEILTKFFGIKQYELKEITEDLVNKRIILDIERPGPCYCNKCGNVGGRYDSSCQEFLIGSINGKAVHAKTKIYRVRCPFHGVVTEDHGLSEGKKRYSKQIGETVTYFTKELYNEAAARLLGLSASTVYRIDYDRLEKMQKCYLKDLPDLKHLGVDEIAYKRRHNYASVISDYDSSKVMWIEKGRTTSSLEKAYDKISSALKTVSVVAMDFWKAFENVTRLKLPNAKIVYDRFHLSRLLNRAVESERRAYQNSLNDDDRKHIKKHTRWLLLKRQANLTAENLNNLEQLKTLNERLYELYLLKEEFLSIFSKENSRETAEELIIKWICNILELNFESLKSFARSVLKRLKNILYWFSNPISNAKSEGINNVIRTLLKRAYGYKNFDYFRMKVLQKCGLLMNYATHTF